VSDVVTPATRSAVPAPTALAAPIILQSNWPPKPQDMVNVTGILGTAVPIGSTFAVYTTPPDRWLVITNLSFYSPQHL
jgi:hypothetical protein